MTEATTQPTNETVGSGDVGDGADAGGAGGSSQNGEGAKKQVFVELWAEVLFRFFIRPNLSPFVICLKKPTDHWLSSQIASPNWLDNQ